MHKLPGAFETNGGTVSQLRVDATARGAHQHLAFSHLPNDRAAGRLDLSNGDGTKDLDPSPRHLLTVFPSLPFTVVISFFFLSLPRSLEARDDGSLADVARFFPPRAARMRYVRRG